VASEWYFTLPILRIIFLSLRSMFGTFCELLLARGLPALEALVGMPVWPLGKVPGMAVPGTELPGTTVWAAAALVVRAKAAASSRKDFIEEEVMIEEYN
jgi:hypothetical protein